MIGLYKTLRRCDSHDYRHFRCFAISKDDARCAFCKNNMISLSYHHQEIEFTQECTGEAAKRICLTSQWFMTDAALKEAEA